MIRVGEDLFGEYDWERFDLLVLPPSFPYGGMENPRMVFLTPTVIKGDATGAQVVAHELAHSWTGNLITNKTNEDFWLNEGFTTYAERRIVEVVQGNERAALNIGIGWRGLNDEMERFKDNMEFTKLTPKQEGVDPDDIYSQVPVRVLHVPDGWRAWHQCFHNLLGVVLGILFRLCFKFTSTGS